MPLLLSNYSNKVIHFLRISQVKRTFFVFLSVFCRLSFCVYKKSHYICKLEQTSYNQNYRRVYYETINKTVSMA